MSKLSAASLLFGYGKFIGTKMLLVINFQVTEQIMDEKLGRMVTRVVLPRVVMHSRYHYAVNFNSLCCAWNCVLLMKTIHFR